MRGPGDHPGPRRHHAMHARARETLFRLTLAATAWVGALSVLSLFGFLAWFSLPLLEPGALSEILSWDWRPFHGAFGILPMVAGSLLLSASAMALAFPLGVGVCCFIHGMGPPRAVRPVMAVVKFMTSIPTVIYGFVSVFLLVPLVRDGFGHGSGFSWLAASLTLSVLVLPTVVLMLHSRMAVVEPEVRLTAAALGLTRGQALLRVVLPLSRRGLLAAAVLGFGRAVGDTLVPLMLAGNAAQLPGSPLDAMRTMTAHIALVVATDSQSKAYLSLFACGMILLLVTTAVNLGLRWVGAPRNPSGAHL